MGKVAPAKSLTLWRKVGIFDTELKADAEISSFVRCTSYDRANTSASLPFLSSLHRGASRKYYTIRPGHRTQRHVKVTRPDISHCHVPHDNLMTCLFILFPTPPPKMTDPLTRPLNPSFHIRNVILIHHYPHAFWRVRSEGHDLSREETKRLMRYGLVKVASQLLDRPLNVSRLAYHDT